MQLKQIVWTLTGVFLIGIFVNSALAVADNTAPKLVIIIDNLGDLKQPGLKVAALPGPLACSILPHRRYSAKIAELCYKQNKTVILNIPMQAQHNYPLGPGGLRAGMPKAEFSKILTDDIASVPYLQGIDNQMGSALTAQEQPMSWIMATIKPYNLFFLDNKTSPHSVVEQVAKNNQVPVISRDIFLDNVRTTQAVDKQFSEALKIAKRYGIAVVVAHPYGVTLDYLQTALPKLAGQGYQLATVAEVLKPAMKQDTSIKLPTISSADSETIELNVNKDHQVVINSINDKVPANTFIAKITTANKNDQRASNETTPQLRSAESAKQSTSAAQIQNPSLITRLENKLVHLWQKEAVEPVANTMQPSKQPPAPAVPVTAKLVIDKSPVSAHNEKSASKKSTKPAKVHLISKTSTTKPVEIKSVAVTDKSEVAPASATDEPAAKQSLVQRIKDRICQHYSSFCTEKKPLTTIAVTETDFPSFVDAQGKLHWPTTGAIITHFGSTLGDSRIKYNGVLIQAPAGQPVHAISKGRVVFANWLHGLGLLVIIDHGDGFMSLYGHNQALYKKVGDIVRSHDLIAAVGNSGEPGPTGLYFEIRHNGQPLNPANWCG